MSDLILYTTEDGKSQIQLWADLGTVWLTQLEMAELFQTSKQNIAKHLKAIFAEQELAQDSVVNQRLTTDSDGKNYQVAHYNLDAILFLETAELRTKAPKKIAWRFGCKTRSRSSAPTVLRCSPMRTALAMSRWRTVPTRNISILTNAAKSPRPAQQMSGTMRS